MPYDARAIANYFLERARREGKALDQMKIQKLVYFANGWHIAIKGEPLIDEQVEAWRYGPVIQSLRDALREYGDQSIDAPISYLVPRVGVNVLDAIEEVVPTIDTANAPDLDFVRALLDRVWQVYGKYTGIQLSNMTHEPGSPWDQVNARYGGQIPKRTDIPVEMIREHFRALARKKVASG
ncbi:MAG: Panacea domain-containing protein [Isosphaeraceae bacterium]